MWGKVAIRSFAVVFMVLAFAVTAIAADTVKIPVASPFTGQLATFGEPVKDGAMLKAEEVNAADSSTCRCPAPGRAIMLTL